MIKFNDHLFIWMKECVCGFIAAESTRVQVTHTMTSVSRMAISFRPSLNSSLPAVLSSDYFFSVSSGACARRVSSRPSFVFTTFYNTLLLPTVSLRRSFHFDCQADTSNDYSPLFSIAANRYPNTRAVNHSLISPWMSLCVVVVGIATGWGRCMRSQKIFVFALLADS